MIPRFQVELRMELAKLLKIVDEYEDAEWRDLSLDDDLPPPYIDEVIDLVDRFVIGPSREILTRAHAEVRQMLFADAPRGDEHPAARHGSVVVECPREMGTLTSRTAPTSGDGQASEAVRG